MNRIIKFSIIILLVITLCGCMLSKNKIFDIVNYEQDMLNTVLEDYPNMDMDELEKMGIKHIADYPGGCINFDCGNGYDEHTGFYFSETDTPMGWEGEDMTLQEDGEGWSYKDCCYYYTQRIKENWFYFYVSY